MLITGSCAIKYWFPVFRETKDIDYLCTRDEYETFIKANKKNIILIKGGKKKHKTVYTVYMNGSSPIEFDVGENENSTEQFLNYYGNLEENYISITPDYIYAMKMSHRFKKNSPHFNKTMDDITFLRLKGCSIPKCLQEWFRLREKETYDYGHPKLAQSKGDFFDPNIGVKYVYDHDSIHESIKFFDRPAFELIKEDKADVFCSKTKFLSLPYELQLATVQEETYVLSLERNQIPNNFTPDPKKSFLMSLEKVCTSIASGWWREFAWENYYEVVEKYDRNYIDKFKIGLANGVVKDYHI